MPTAKLHQDTSQQAREASERAATQEERKPLKTVAGQRLYLGPVSCLLVCLVAHLLDLSLALQQQQLHHHGQTNSTSTVQTRPHPQGQLGVSTGRPNYLETGRQITGILDRFMSLGYDKRVRPNYGGPPVEVNVTMRILSISSVSEVMMDFTADFYFRQTWHDPRLSFKKLGDIQTLYVGAEVSKKIWLPDTFFGNEKMAYFHEATTPNVFLRIDHSGEVYRSIRLTVTSSCPMNLQYFPMDRQRCTIEAESYGYNIKDIIYRWARKETAVERDKEISLPQFDIVQTVQKYRLEELSSGTYSRLIAELHFARRMGYYLIQIYIPSSLIVVISWVSFWLHRNASPARVQLGVTTVLTMTTLMSSTNAALPKISYVKSIDIFLGTCFVMVFAALLEYATVGYLGKRIAMRKAQAQHAQAQANARLLGQLQAMHGAEHLPPTSSAIAAAAAMALSAQQAAASGNLFGSPPDHSQAHGATGLASNEPFGGHSAGVHSSPVLSLGPLGGARAGDQHLGADCFLASMADPPPASPTPKHGHHHHHHHHHWHHCPEDKSCPKHQQQQHGACAGAADHQLEVDGRAGVACCHQPTARNNLAPRAATLACKHHHQQRQQVHLDQLVLEERQNCYSISRPEGKQRRCACERNHCDSVQMADRHFNSVNKVHTLPRNITFAAEHQSHQITPEAPLRHTSVYLTDSRSTKMDQTSNLRSSSSRQFCSNSALPMPPAYLAQNKSPTDAATAAAAQFVNLHRRNKGLPPSSNPNFAQFTSANPPFAMPYNRALETIFGIRPSDIDKYSRVVFPVCFVCFQLMYWIVYLHISAFFDAEQSGGQQQPVASMQNGTGLPQVAT